MKSDSISQENDDNILKKINQSISQLMLLEIELEKKNDSLETQLNSELGVKTRKDMVKKCGLFNKGIKGPPTPL